MVLWLLLTVGVALQAQTGVINTDQTRLRVCDDKGCQTKKTVNKGTKFTVIGRGKAEYIDGYGLHPWLKIKIGQSTQGYVFAALVDFDIDLKEQVKMDTSAFVREANVNVRACPRLYHSVPLFQLDKGQYVEVLRQSKDQEDIDGLGENYWYFVRSDKQAGYAFGSLLTFATAQLRIDSSNVKAYDTYSDNRMVRQRVSQGQYYQIKAQSAKSHLIRPYGRHYWYQLAENGQSIGWVFGVFTSKNDTQVDCQCVDYVKNKLSITGPTKNAFEWEDALFGRIPVIVNGQPTTLDYEEILDVTKTKKGDIVIFDRLHPQVDANYGHIGILDKPVRSSTQTDVVVIGGNHKVDLKAYYSDAGCHNVSRKTYRLDSNVRFYRPAKSRRATTNSATN
ncbi:MAG: CHAP domain-containing protein [Bacteroidota bacterium]